MSESARNYKLYEYKELAVSEEKAGFYLDSYASFGWELDDNFPPKTSMNVVNFHLKRDRKIANKAELTRLQRNFEANIEQLREMERAKTSTASIWAMSIGLIGTAFIAGSVFAIVGQMPHYALSVLLAVPGFAGWAAPIFVHRKVRASQARKLAPYIEEKTEELYALCEKGQALL